MKVKDLEDQTIMNDSDKRRNYFLWCPNCDAEVSANKGDYFLASDDMELTCQCGHSLILANKTTIYEEVSY